MPRRAREAVCSPKAIRLRFSGAARVPPPFHGRRHGRESEPDGRADRVDRVTTDVRIEGAAKSAPEAALDAKPSGDATPSERPREAHEATAPPRRDLRLDFFRGLALFCIFLDHLPENVLSLVTLQQFQLSDAAEVFILISGYAAGMVYGGVCERQGLLWATARVYHRVWQLYVAHIFLFVLFIATVGHSASRLNSALFAEELGAADFLKEPDVAVVKALTLQFQPIFMDILPLYIVLLAALPFVLVGLRHWPGPVLASSGLLWLTAQLFESVAVPAYPGPDHTWFFNPFAWQALFFLGVWLGWRGRGGLPSWVHSRWVFVLAIAVTLGAFAIRASWTLHWLNEAVPALFLKELWPLTSKSDLAVLRFANVLALALLVARLVKPQAQYLSGSLARPFIGCGRHSLHVFCLGILLAVVARLVVIEYFSTVVIQIAMGATGLAIMIGMAALMDWFQSMARSKTPAVAHGGA
jgi:hypothetical protein